MPKHCVATECSNKGGEGYSLHEFPHEPQGELMCGMDTSSKTMVNGLERTDSDFSSLLKALPVL